MPIPQSPTTEWPSTDATLTILVGPDRMPAVTASAAILVGTESVSARIEVDDAPKHRSRHSAHFAMLGDRASVLAVLDQLRAAVVAAQPPVGVSE
jgi:hypothetical protein